MDEPIEVLYFNWLYSKVSDIHVRSRKERYVNLFTLLHRIEFVWMVVGDDNRIEDARDMRKEFLHESFLPDLDDIFMEGCSVLEMLIAFSRKASFVTDDSLHLWFWIMLSNLGISDLNDYTEFDEVAIQLIVERFVFRTYTRKGRGGLFPMRRTNYDQRGVEIWYQFNQYLDDVGR